MAHIAIVEDSALVIQMLTMVCEGAGHQVESHECFDDAAEQLRKKAPDLIITDLNLPDVPEDDTIRQLRAIEGLENTPIIVVSGRPRQELVEIADASGAQGALSKDDGMPVVSAELPPMIDELVG